MALTSLAHSLSRRNLTAVAIFALSPIAHADVLQNVTSKIVYLSDAQMEKIQGMGYSFFQDYWNIYSGPDPWISDVRFEQPSFLGVEYFDRSLNTLPTNPGQAPLLPGAPTLMPGSMFR